jgi:hypothetical protein
LQTTATLGAQNTDATLKMGGGFWGMIWELQIFASVLTTPQLLALATYNINYPYCQALINALGNNPGACYASAAPTYVQPPGL